MINRERAVIQNAHGVETTFYRGRRSPESQVAWELLDNST
jgi:hypothetical protein